MSTCTAIAANSDVSGIGIRVNLYITALIIAFIPTNPTNAEAARKSGGAELLEIVSSGAAISGVSLLITAVTQTAQGQLSLFHAIFVIHMLYFTGIVIVPAGHYRSESVTARLIRVGLAIVLVYGSIMLFIGYALYVWVKAPTFGSFPECNDQIKYIFFFHSVSATTGWLRKLWIAALAITFGVLVIFPLAFAILSHGRPKAPIPQYSASQNLIAWCIVRFSRLLTAVYGIAMLELYMSRNKHLIAAGEEQWSFGQIMALVQIFGIMNEVVHCVISNAPKVKKRIQKVWPKEVEKGQQGSEKSLNSDS
jgi:hypothetical protein